MDAQTALCVLTHDAKFDIPLLLIATQDEDEDEDEDEDVEGRTMPFRMSMAG